jgi:hypothetical protein
MDASRALPKRESTKKGPINGQNLLRIESTLDRPELQSFSMSVLWKVRLRTYVMQMPSDMPGSARRPSRTRGRKPYQAGIGDTRFLVGI